jgi:hypothetical protein
LTSGIVYDILYPIINTPFHSYLKDKEVVLKMDSSKLTAAAPLLVVL